jgi:hypothetical protein
LQSGLSLHHPPEDPGPRCCPSSLYTFPAAGSLRAWLGIAISGFPEFGQFCIAGTQVSLSPLSLALTMRNYWFYSFAHVKMCKFMCKFWRISDWS